MTEKYKELESVASPIIKRAYEAHGGAPNDRDEPNPSADEDFHHDEL